MPEYRRTFIAGRCCFVTVTLFDWRSGLLVAEIGLLREAGRQMRARRPLVIDAWVVLPDHMHCVWTLPDGDADCPERWRAINVAFSKDLSGAGRPNAMMAPRGAENLAAALLGAHDPRCRDYAAHVDTVHFNPVKHGYVPRPED